MRAGLRQEVSSQEECSRSPLKLPDAVLQGGLGDPRIALRPVIAAAGDQPHPIAIPLNAGEAVVLGVDGISDFNALDNGCGSRLA